jgi:hypothetical protein
MVNCATQSTEQSDDRASLPVCERIRPSCDSYRSEAVKVLNSKSRPQQDLRR